MEDIKITTLLFADDVVLIADCPNKLQNLLDALGKWCTDNQMTINPDKTKIVHFRNPKKKVCEFRFTCRETPIHYTEYINTWGWSSLSILAGRNQLRILQYLLIKQLAT